MKQCGAPRTAQPTEPRISLDRKAISERFLQIFSPHKQPENLGFPAGIALRCRTGLGSLAQHSGTAIWGGTQAVSPHGDSAMNDAFSSDTEAAASTLSAAILIQSLSIRAALPASIQEAFR